MDASDKTTFVHKVAQGSWRREMAWSNSEVFKTLPLARLSRQVIRLQLWSLVSTMTSDPLTTQPLLPGVWPARHPCHYTRPSHFDAPPFSCLWGRTDPSVCPRADWTAYPGRGTVDWLTYLTALPAPLPSEPESFTVLCHTIAVVTGENNSKLFWTTLPASSLSIQTNTPP